MKRMALILMMLAAVPVAAETFNIEIDPSKAEGFWEYDGSADTFAALKPPTSTATAGLFSPNR